MKEHLLSKIKSRDAKIGIVGLGYVGLPNLLHYTNQDFFVTGFDIDKQKIESLKNNKSYIRDVKSRDLEINSDKFYSTDDFSLLNNQDIIFIDVPTPIFDDKTPDYRYVESACNSVIDNSKLGQLIILESTVSPGSTYKYIVKKLEDRGYKVGKDIFVGYSPERIDPGNIEYTFSEISRIVSGYTKNCLKLMEELFGNLGHSVTSLEVAELTKLYENAFRFINIAFVDEISRLTEYMGISFDEVANAANSKQYGFMKFTPTYGIGGHCIPVDPFYLLDYSHKLGVSMNLISMAGDINDSMIYILMGKIDKYLGNYGEDNIKIAVIGASYKANIKDTRMSVVHKLSNKLHEENIDFEIYDDIDQDLKIGRYGKTIRKVDYREINDCTLAIILQEHDYIDFSKISIKKLYATRF